MTPKKFITTAIEGGWGKNMWYRSQLLRCENVIDHDVELIIFQGELECEQNEYMKIEEILLDPATWQAVGKVKGWDWEGNTTLHSHIQLPPGTEAWEYRMYRMISALIDGKTLEEYLAILN